VSEKEIRHTEDFGINWGVGGIRMSSRKVAFGDKTNSSDGYPQA